MNQANHDQSACILECSHIKHAESMLFDGSWMELCAKIDELDALSCAIFLARLYFFWIEERPALKKLVSDGDSMGGLCLSLEMSSPNGRMWIEYEHSIRESWSSLELLKSEGGVEFSNCQPYLWHLNLIGSGILRLWLPPHIDSSMEAIRNLAEEHFEEATVK